MCRTLDQEQGLVKATILKSFYAKEKQKEEAVGRLAVASTLCEYREDGSFIMKSPEKLKPYARCVGEWLDYWADKKPNHPFLSEREGDGWKSLTYAETRDKVGRIAQGLLNLKMPTCHPIVFLSGNGLSQALVTLAAYHVGIPVATISAAYSLRPTDFSRLNWILNTLEPSAVFVDDGAKYEKALRGVEVDSRLIIEKNAELFPQAVTFDSLLEATETEEVNHYFEQVGPNTVARYLMTSGSTADPKFVVHTQRVLCSNQQAISQCWRFIEESEIVVVDWLPWSHVFASNHNFNIVLRNGGSLYIDDGMATDQKIERTIENIKMVKPTLYFNVPRGYELLLPYLEEDQELAEALFGRLELLFYAGAALPKVAWNRLEKVASSCRTTPLFIATEWGTTETAPVITNVHYTIDGPGNIGLPVPGVEVKFVPNEEKYEMRVRGEFIFTRYLGDPAMTENAFDEEGFYYTGDAGYLANPQRPEQGIIFDGRITEDFKLNTGTWVSAGVLRPLLVDAFSPYALDFVITGHDQKYASAMMFPTKELYLLADDPEQKLDVAELSEHPKVRKELLTRMHQFYKENSGSSRHIKRLIILDALPCLESGETTDKAYINQRKTLARRQDQVMKLYAAHPGREVIRLSELEEQ